MKRLKKEFITFISRGNVMELAVGIIIGGAFGTIVSSLVDDILMPVVGIIFGGHDLSSLSHTIGNSTIAYGMFLQSIVNFLIIALTIFMMITIINRINRKKESEAPPAPSEEIVLLSEIRDLLKKKD